MNSVRFIQPAKASIPSGAMGLVRHAEKSLVTHVVQVATSHLLASGESWSGKSAGVRKPEAWETPLSASEIAHGLTEGVI